MKQSANACPILSFTLSHFVVIFRHSRLAVNANDFSHFIWMFFRLIFISFYLLFGFAPSRPQFSAVSLFSQYDYAVSRSQTIIINLLFEIMSVFFIFYLNIIFLLRCVVCRMLCFILLNSSFHLIWVFSNLFLSFHLCSTLRWFDAFWINKMGLRLWYGSK